MTDNTPPVYQLPPLLARLLRLPVINRLPVAQQPKEFARFLKFAIVGVTGMVVDLSILNLLHRVILPPILPGMETASRLLVANSFSFTAAVISNFTWNRLWTFPESRRRPIIPQLGQYTFVNVIGLGINNVVLYAVFHLVVRLIPDPFDYNLAKITAIGVVLFWNYFVNRAWTYRGIE